MSNACHTPGPKVGAEQPFIPLTGMYPHFSKEEREAGLLAQWQTLGPMPRPPDSQAYSRLKGIKPLHLLFLVRVYIPLSLSLPVPEPLEVGSL